MTDKEQTLEIPVTANFDFLMDLPEDTENAVMEGSTMSYFTVYMTTNLVNHKIYIGAHTTDDPDDKYLGSGKLILEAIKEYGKAAFKKEVLCLAKDARHMFEIEHALVDKDFCALGSTYNILPGGGGPFTRKMSPGELKAHNQQISERAKERFAVPENNPMFGTHRTGESNPFYGRTHTRETIEKLREINTGKVLSEEHKAKISTSLREAGLVAWNKGKKQEYDAWNKGKHISEEHKTKISKYLATNHPRGMKGKKHKRETCPHCRKEVAVNILHQFHLDKCRHKGG